MITAVQKQNLQTFATPVFFIGMAFLAGSKRLIQYFPGASKEGLLCSASLASASVIASGLKFSKNDSELKRRVCIVAGLIISAVITPSILKSLMDRVDLNFMSSIRFAFVEASMFGVIETSLFFMQNPLPDGVLISDQWQLSEDAMSALQFIEMNPQIRTGSYVGEEFINACRALRENTPFEQGDSHGKGHGTHIPAFEDPIEFLKFITLPTEKDDRSNPFFFIIGCYEDEGGEKAEVAQTLRALCTSTREILREKGHI